MRDEFSRYMSASPCETCDGYRLKPEAMAVKIDGLHIGQVTEMSIKAAGDWFTSLPEQLNEKQQEIAVRILKEIRERLAFLNDVGLDYLTLSRNSGTLSGGESQRIRLASQIGSGLTGVLYVLDEPSIGLHQRDNERLLETLKHLRDLGNTVIVVEHDEDAIQSADHVQNALAAQLFAIGVFRFGYRIAVAQHHITRIKSQISLIVDCVIIDTQRRVSDLGVGLIEIG